MPNPPTYACQRVIIQHVSPNFRYLLASRIPSVRAIHENVPLKIKTLTFKEASFHVDGLEHEFQKCLYPVRAPVQFDFDENGVEEFVMEQGDVQLLDSVTKSFVDSINNTEQRVPRGVPATLQYSLNRSSRYFHLDSVYKLYPEGYKLRDAIRLHLRNFMSVETIVGYLVIDEISGVLRFPLGQKFHVQKLELRNPSLKSILGIIKPSSYPLNNLYFSTLCLKKLDVLNVDSGLTDTLTIVVNDDVFREKSFAEEYLKTGHKNVRVVREFAPQAELNAVASLLTARPKEIGTKLEFETEKVQEKLRLIQEHTRASTNLNLLKSCSHSPHCVTVQLNTTTQLNICGLTVPSGKELLIFEFTKLGLVRET